MTMSSWCVDQATHAKSETVQVIVKLEIIYSVLSAIPTFFNIQLYPGFVKGWRVSCMFDSGANVFRIDSDSTL